MNWNKCFYVIDYKAYYWRSNQLPYYLKLRVLAWNKIGQMCLFLGGITEPPVTFLRFSLCISIVLADRRLMYTVRMWTVTLLRNCPYNEVNTMTTDMETVRHTHVSPFITSIRIQVFMLKIIVCLSNFAYLDNLSLQRIRHDCRRILELNRPLSERQFV